MNDVVPEVPEAKPIAVSKSRVDGSPLITAPSQRLSTMAGRKGFDIARQIVDQLRMLRRKGQRPDLILISRRTHRYLNTTWLELGCPSDTIPRDIDGVELKVGDDTAMQGVDYAFLRDYIPWEKRLAKEQGIVLYGEGIKKLIAVEH